MYEVVLFVELLVVSVEMPVHLSRKILIVSSGCAFICLNCQPQNTPSYVLVNKQPCTSSLEFMAVYFAPFQLFISSPVVPCMHATCIGCFRIFPRENMHRAAR